jgi:hypothetical protein
MYFATTTTVFQYFSHQRTAKLSNSICICIQFVEIGQNITRANYKQPFSCANSFSLSQGVSARYSALKTLTPESYL